MLYRPSDSRTVLDQWIRNLLARMTPPGPSARTLDEITVTEVLDLAYQEGARMDACLAAHAIVPQYVENNERVGGPSAMSVRFPMTVNEIGPAGGEDEERVGVRVAMKWGQGSELKIGDRGRARVVNPGRLVPTALKRPRIGGTVYDLGEVGGDRLLTVAGPMREFAHSVDVAFHGPVGEAEFDILSPPEDLVYATADGHGAITADRDQAGGFIGRVMEADVRRTHALYLWGETRGAAVSLRVHWMRQRADRVTVTVSLRNLTQARDEDRASASVLGALLMPQVIVTTIGGLPDFPPQQYAEAKESLVMLADEESRREESTRRLYAVGQSGCIATRSPVSHDMVVLSTFGVFDTPREAPAPGPTIASLSVSPDDFLAAMSGPSESARNLVTERWTVLRSILMAAGNGFRLDRLHRFQWDAIQVNLEFVSTGAHRPVTVVRAPTGAGKTIVFLVNAAVSALCSGAPGTAVLMFPTRLLNEDMFRRLAAFVCALRGQAATAAVTGGLLMGTSDPLYRVLLKPDPGEPMHHFGPCPACGASPLFAAAGTGRAIGRLVPTCRGCGHVVDYMYTTFDVAAFLPDIIIATPDKLLYEATVQGFEQYRIGMFGAPVRRCTTCGRACPESYLALKPEAVRCQSFHRNTECTGNMRGDVEVRAVRYMGFDEVHSLYGVTATYLSMFLADLEALQVFLAQRPAAGPEGVGIRYETATATISNETELIEALTRRRDANGEVVLIPAEGRAADYFQVVDESIRYRVLTTLPIKISSKQAFIRSVLNAYEHLRGEHADLEDRLGAHTLNPGDWAFLLGYLFKKQEGADMRRALRDMYRNEIGADLRVEFLSGEAPKDQISAILSRALAGEIDILLANLVISLGVDIHGLNHMIMLGLTQSFTEFVQTAGRTGRGRSSGHVHILLQPWNPRDAYLYRHFHAVLSDVTGYYDVLPVKSTNLFCAGEMFGNVAKSLLVAICMRRGRARWANANGVRDAIGAREAQLRAGIAGILCDDPALLTDTRALVDARFRALMDQLAQRNDFVGNVLSAPGSNWLITSLRGRPGNTVRVTCADDALLARLRAPQGGHAVDDVDDD
jgi:hypothetical protein